MTLSTRKLAGKELAEHTNYEFIQILTVCPALVYSQLFRRPSFQTLVAPVQEMMGLNFSRHLPTAINMLI
jgi:hypothetical protein